MLFTKERKNFIKSILALGIDLLFSFGLSKTYFLRLKKILFLFILDFCRVLKRFSKVETQFNFFLISCSNCAAIFYISEKIKWYLFCGKYQSWEFLTQKRINYFFKLKKILNCSTVQCLTKACYLLINNFVNTKRKYLLFSIK